MAEITNIFEISIRVMDFDSSVAKWSKALGMNPIFMDPKDIPTPGIQVAVFHIGEVAVSLLGSLNEDSFIAEALRTKGEGVDLIGMDVTDIEEFMKEGRGLVFDFPKPQAYVAGTMNSTPRGSMNGVNLWWSQHSPDWDIVGSTHELWDKDDK